MKKQDQVLGGEGTEMFRYLGRHSSRARNPQGSPDFYVIQVLSSATVLQVTHCSISTVRIPIGQFLVCSKQSGVSLSKF